MGLYSEGMNYHVQTTVCFAKAKQAPFEFNGDERKFRSI